MFRKAIPSCDARRGAQSRKGSDAPDVMGVPWFWIECKVGKSPNAAAALAQARDACGQEELWPIAVIKRDRQDPYVCIGLTDFMHIVGRLGGC
jgi:hypothetical protein